MTIKDKITIDLKCLYCKETLQTYKEIEKDKANGFLVCQKCKKKNDYNSLFKIAMEKGKDIAKKEAIKILKNALKNIK